MVFEIVMLSAELKRFLPIEKTWLERDPPSNKTHILMRPAVNLKNKRGKYPNSIKGSSTYDIRFLGR